MLSYSHRKTFGRTMKGARMNQRKETSRSYWMQKMHDLMKP